ncbi:MAG: hypothetical protein NVSMB19_07870 [Vulcanimicrobiaceae bacterium]
MCASITPALQAARGGDWCEAFAVSEHVIALSVGDVCGHGAERYDVMSVVAQTVRNATLSGLDPAQALAATNRVVCGLEPELYATALLVLLDTRREAILFANAGHPPPLVVGRAGSRYLVDADAGADVPLGVDPHQHPALHAASTPANTLLVLYTDGVTEHARRPAHGERSLREAAQWAYRQRAAPTASAIEESLYARGSNRDDAAILTAWLPRAWKKRQHRRASGWRVREK